MDLWNEDRTRFTVLYDPGRVKRGILPNEEMGRLAAVPLVLEGIAAARPFLDAQAFGPWSRGSENKALRAAARRAGTDVADIQVLYLHTSLETAMIYK